MPANLEPFLHCNSAMCRVTFNCLNLPVFCRAQRKAAPARRTQGRHAPAQTVQTQETDQRQQADRAAHTSLALGLACGRGCGVSLSGQAASVVLRAPLHTQLGWAARSTARKETLACASPCAWSYCSVHAWSGARAAGSTRRKRRTGRARIRARKTSAGPVAEALPATARRRRRAAASAFTLWTAQGRRGL